MITTGKQRAQERVAYDERPRLVLIAQSEQMQRLQCELLVCADRECRRRLRYEINCLERSMDIVRGRIKDLEDLSYGT